MDDGNDIDAIGEALSAARVERDRPSLILVRTHLGYGSPHKQDTFEAHGSPLGAEEVRLTKQNLGWPLEPDFLVPPEALARFREALERGKGAQMEWEAKLQAYVDSYPELGAAVAPTDGRRATAGVGDGHTSVPSRSQGHGHAGGVGQGDGGVG